MERSIERVPTWALPYMANGDATGPIADSVQGGMPPYYTKDPLFGKATEVEDCIVFYNI